MTSKSEQKLKDSFTILSVFHFIVGALSFMMSFIPVIYLIIGFVLVVAPETMETGSRDQEVLVGWVFLTISTLVILLGLTIAVSTMMAGYFMTKARRYGFCFTVAIVECLFFPLGTALGVVTLIVLSKDETKRLFGKPVVSLEREN